MALTYKIMSILFSAVIIMLTLSFTNTVAVSQAQPAPFYEGNTVRQINITKKTAAEKYIPNIVNGVSLILAGVAVVVLIIAGIQYIIAFGDADKVTKAHKALLYSFMALFLIMFSYGIVYLILGILPNS